MVKKVIEASEAIAEAVKLCSPAVVPMYPITPQIHIVEHIASFINNGDMDAEMIHSESEHSAISSALGVVAAGARTFTATSSQGLALMHEILFVVSGMRLPMVMVVANRALSAPINIWNDQQDSISERDAGWIQLYAETSQEALDTVIQAFKIAEDKNVLLPAMVCIDGYSLSHMFEPVDIPTKVMVNRFLPKYKPTHAYLDPKKPMTLGPVGFPNTYMYFKHDQQKAMLGTLSAIKKANSDFKKRFRRGYGDGLIETYKIDDAKYAVVGMGTVCGTSRVVVDKLRKEGKKIGLIKIRSFRPFPAEDLAKTTKKLKALAVFDRDISFGSNGALFTEIKAALNGEKKIINGFIVGLGGRDITPEMIERAINKTMKAKDTSEEWMIK